jgi:hypothetical protein
MVVSGRAALARAVTTPGGSVRRARVRRDRWGNFRTPAPTAVQEQACDEAAGGVLAALPSWVQGSRHGWQVQTRSRRVPERTGTDCASFELQMEGEEGVCGCCCGGGGGYMEEEEEEEEEDYGSDVEIEGALEEDEEDEEIDEDGDEEGDDDVLDNVLPDDLDSEVGVPRADGVSMEVRIAAQNKCDCSAPVHLHLPALCPHPMPSHFAQDNEEDVDLEVIRPATARRRSPDKLGVQMDEAPTLCEMVRACRFVPSSHAAILHGTFLRHAKAPLAISGQGMV